MLNHIMVQMGVSHLCRPLPHHLQSIMLATDDVGRLRWARVLAELVRLLSPLCPTSMAVAYLETLYQLGRCGLQGPMLELLGGLEPAGLLSSM
jgi:hypothetical protein